jgi:threonine dehydrogenase-like Zn-dependent dehydrogenase
MHRSAEMRPGDAVVVQGVGQHGIGCVIAARRTGAGAVIAVGANGDDDRLKTALQCGATATINADAEDPTAAVLDLTAGRGADVVIDATPSVNAASAAISMAGVGARIVYAGTKAGAATALDTDSIYQKELVIRGVSARESWAIPEALRWLAADPELFRPIFSVEVSLDDLEDGLRALGGEGSAERPLHAIVVPRPSQE